MNNKPRIRFKDFNIDWEQRKLSEVVTGIKRTDEKSDAPVMMITAENGFINQSERYSTNNAGQSLKKYILLEKGELAYNHGASKLRPYGSCFALTTEDKARIPFVYHCFSTETENSEFLSIVLNGKAVEKQLRRIVSSGARMDGLLNISFDEYTSIPVMLPQKDEQDRIADYFKQLENLITLHQRKCEETKNIKKYMLQKMFPKNGKLVPEIRFAGFTDDWKQRKLSDIVDKAVDNRGKTPPISEDGTHPLIEVASLGNGAPDYTKVTKYLDEETFNTALRDYIKQDDILFSTVGSIGLVSLMDSREEAAIAQNIVSFRAKENYDAKYLYAMLSNGDNQDKAWRIVMNGVQPSIKVSQLINVEYCVTINKDEQKKIGEYFYYLDNLITLHQLKCDNLKEVKKYMLQNMFPVK